MASFADYQEFIGRLSKFKEYQPGKAKACCPGHEDSHPSMTLGIGDDGRLLVQCKTGCSFARICEGAGVTSAAFFPPGEWKGGTRGDPLKRGRIVQQFEYERLVGPGEVETVCAVALIVIDKTGSTQTRVRLPNLRFNPHVPEADDNQQYTWSGSPPACLYRQPELDGRRLLFVVDSEEDANVLFEGGGGERKYQATTVPLGFREFRAEHAAMLRGFNVCVIAGCDNYGGEGDSMPHADRAKQVAKILLGQAATVRVLFLKDAPRGAGFGTWLSNRPGDPAAALKDFEAAVTKAPLVSTHAALAAVRPPLNSEAERIPEYVAACAAAMNPERLKKLAESLGLPVDSLGAFDGIGYDARQHCFVFPELGSNRQLVGASRRWSNGSKANVNASRRGLTIPAGFGMSDDSRPILVFEGASDTIAATHAGLRAIGRPSNCTGGELILNLLWECGAGTEVIVFGENDKREKNGLEVWPGRDGAEKVVQDLYPLTSRGASVWMMFPPEGFKDARQFLTARQDSWDERGKTFLLRSGYSGSKAVAEVQTRRSVPELIAERLNEMRGERKATDIQEAVANYDTLSVKIAGKSESSPKELEKLLVEVCAELVYRAELARNARRST